jgi:hypothetical protein
VTTWNLTAALSGSGQLSAGGFATRRTAAHLAASPTMSATGAKLWSGVATLHASVQFSAAAVVSRRAAPALAASPRLNAVAASIQKGAAHLAASPVLAVGGTATALAAAPALRVSGRVIKIAQASLAAQAVLTAKGAVPTLSARPALTAAAVVTERAQAALTAVARLTAFYSSASAALHAGPVLLVPGRAAAVALTAGTQLTATGQRFMPGAASLSASPALGAGAKITEVARAPLAAAPLLTAGPLVTERATAHLGASASLTAFFSSASAGLHAVPVLTAAASAIRAAQAHLTTAGSLSCAGKVTEPAAALLAAHSTLQASGHKTQHAQASLHSAPVLTSNAHHTVSAQAALAAAAALHTSARRIAVAVAVLHAAPALHAAATTSPGAHLHAQPVLTAAGVPRRAAKCALSSRAVLTATAHGTTRPGSTLAAFPVLAAVPLGVIVSRASMAASASLAAVAVTVFNPPLAPHPPRMQPAWERDVQHFAVTQERQRHAQALWQYGELVMFCLLWRPADIDAGLARRCTRCYVPGQVIPLTPALPDSSAAAEAQISAAYGQGSQYRCTLCYGTQIIAAQPAEVPGVRALLVRPAILTDTDQNQQRTAKGVVNPGSVGIQATPDFRAHTLDYMFRGDGRRYQLSVPGRVTLRTGFASPWQQAAGIAYNLLNATLENRKASVAYVIPPADQLLEQALGTYTRIPAGYAWIEEINGPLIPGETPPPAASGRYQAPIVLGS